MVSAGVMTHIHSDGMRTDNFVWQSGSCDVQGNTSAISVECVFLLINRCAETSFRYNEWNVTDNSSVKCMKHMYITYVEDHSDGFQCLVFFFTSVLCAINIFLIFMINIKLRLSTMIPFTFRNLPIIPLYHFHQSTSNQIYILDTSCMYLKAKIVGKNTTPIVRS